MKCFANYFIIILTGFLIGCSPKLVEHSFGPMPNIDSLNAVNKLVGKHYYLVDSFKNSDFNYINFSNFDSLAQKTSIFSMEKLFEPINGHYNVYKFISTFRGLAYGDIIKTFHDILILKTDTSNQIIDGYQYTLEWAESPNSIDLYRLSKHNIKFEGLHSVDSLFLECVYSPPTNPNNAKEFLKDNGVIHIK